MMWYILGLLFVLAIIFFLIWAFHVSEISALHDRLETLNRNHIAAKEYCEKLVKENQGLNLTLEAKIEKIEKLNLDIDMFSANYEDAMMQLTSKEGLVTRYRNQVKKLKNKLGE